MPTKTKENEKQLMADIKALLGEAKAFEIKVNAIATRADQFQIDLPAGDKADAWLGAYSDLANADDSLNEAIEHIEDLLIGSAIEWDDK